MPTEYVIRRTLNKSLDAVVTNLYPATFLRWLYVSGLGRLVKAHGSTLPRPEPTTSRRAQASLTKAYLTKLALAALRDKEILRSLYGSLPQSTRKALAILTWGDDTSLDALEADVGEPVADLNPEKRRWYTEAFDLRKQHGFLCIYKKGDVGYYGHHSKKPPRSDYLVVLPSKVRQAFKKVIPPPDDYELLPLKRMKEGALRYTCEPAAIMDIRIVTEYIQQGHLHYTKAERLSKKCIRALTAIVRGGEFFETPDERELEFLRVRILVNALAFAGDKAREHLLVTSGSEPIRECFERLACNAVFLDEELLDHLGSGRDWISFSPKKTAKLKSFFATLPADGGWISFDNIRRYHTLRNLEPHIYSESPTGFDTRIRRRHGWDRRTYLAPENMFELVSETLLKGYAFFLAALGMAEIAYEIPSHPHYTRPERDFLTPFDGLRGIRLTPLGAFALGRKKTYETESDGIVHAKVILDSSRLLATSPNMDPLTELAIKQFMETLAPGRYRMTHKSLLGGCSSRKELEERIRLFRRVIAERPPPLWERFFEESLNQIAPLTLDANRLVLQINGDSHLRHLFTSDPLLRKRCLKVEGLRVAIDEKHLKAVAKRLEKFGYLCPLSSMVPPISRG